MGRQKVGREMEVIRWTDWMVLVVMGTLRVRRVRRVRVMGRWILR